MFFINSLKNPSLNFNISSYVTFSDSSTRSSRSFKLKHARSSFNANRHFYFNHLPRLWNSLPPIDLNQSSSNIKALITKSVWSHFTTHFDSNNSCTYHFLCPCFNAQPLPLLPILPWLLAVLDSSPQCTHSSFIPLLFLLYVYLCTVKIKSNLIKSISHL